MKEKSNVLNFDKFFEYFITFGRIKQDKVLRVIFTASKFIND
jgi:hypothetical protein